MPPRAEPAPPPEPGPGREAPGPTAPWLPAALRAVAADDPALAGSGVVALLPAQGLVTPGELAYDVALRHGPTYAVTVRDGATEVLERSSPRPRRERDFALRGPAAGLGNWATGRRRRGVRGRRRGAALRALAAHPFSLAELDAAGVRPDAELAWRLAAAAIDPSWTEGRRLSLRHEVLGAEPPRAVTVQAADGAPLLVVPARRVSEEEVDATLRTTPGAVLAALRGAAPPAGEMVEEGGDRRVLAALRAWLVRAEHGVRPRA